VTLKKLIGFASLAVYRDRARKRTLTMGGLGFLVFWFLVVGFLVFGFWFRVFTFRDQNSITGYIGRYRPPYRSGWRANGNWQRAACGLIGVGIL
jgi:hypothetical protein